jgi:universal stress protein A
MNSNIRHVLVPVDFTAIANQLVQFGRTVGGGLRAQVHLLHVLEEPFATAAPYEFHLPDPAARREQRYSEARAKLASLADQLRIRNVEVTTEVRSGKAAEEIIEAATDYGADLVVIGPRRKRGLQRLLNGSVTEDVLRHAPCPVLIVREHGGAGTAAAA